MRDRTWPRWLPAIRVVDLRPREALDFDLDPRHRWRILVVEWFDRGIALARWHQPERAR